MTEPTPPVAPHPWITTSPHDAILIVRHGESEWNVLGKWQGRADTQLTDAGRRQATEAGQRLLELGITMDRIVASSLSRARETAEIIAEHIGLDGVIIDERIVETDVGPWEGLREHEIEAAFPHFLRDRRTPENFEAPEAVFARATQTLSEIAAKGGRTLVVSHSGVIRTLRRVMGVHDRRLRNLEGCIFTTDETGTLIAGDFVSLALHTRDTTNDSV